MLNQIKRNGKTNLNSFHTLNGTTMKKQILILFTMLFAGMATVFGQAQPGSAPRTLENCDTGPLNPIAGVPYTYEAETNQEGGTAYWYATLSTIFMQNGSRVAEEQAIGGTVVAAATNYMELISPANNPLSTTITWTSQGLANVDDDNPLFVVVENEGDCSNNMKVYRIEPINAFLVNVINLGGSYDTEVESCISEVQSAEYNLTENWVEYDFGADTLAFEVVAANFTDSYTPTFRIDGLQANQEAEILWSVTNDINTASSVGTLAEDGTLEGDVVTTDVSDTSDGVSIYVWVIVSHNDYEGLEETPITLAVAGENAADQPNVRWDDCNIDVDILAALDADEAPDYATHILTPRPTVTPVDPLEFEDQRTP